jgi:DNA-binding CsgD family transcriptional regulator
LLDRLRGLVRRGRVVYEEKNHAGGPAQQTKFLFFSGDRDFGERERLVLNLLRPHLAALEAAARQRRLATAALLEGGRAGLVVLRSSDKLEFATPAAERLLARCFDGTSDDDLPEPVRARLHHDSRRLNVNTGLPPPATVPLRVERGDHRLTIRRAGYTLLLDGEAATLTPREREIVAQLVEGRSNAEIAERLAIAPTTVRKHLENIYAKLGVNTRTAATAATRPGIERPGPSGSLSPRPMVTRDDKQGQHKVNK